MTRLILTANIEQADSQAEFEVEIARYVDLLSRGRIGASIPTINLTPEAVTRVTDAILRPLNPESSVAIREQVETYVSLSNYLKIARR